MQPAAVVNGNADPVTRDLHGSGLHTSRGRGATRWRSGKHYCRGSLRLLVHSTVPSTATSRHSRLVSSGTVRAFREAEPHFGVQQRNDSRRERLNVVACTGAL